jgi:hypothetical protein
MIKVRVDLVKKASSNTDLEEKNITSESIHQNSNPKPTND